MTAAELKQRFKVVYGPHKGCYYLEPDEMQAFIDQACKEQREKCKQTYVNNGFAKDIETAPKPDGL